MIRYTLFVITVLGSVAAAIAAVAPASSAQISNANITVIEKNQAYPVFGELVFEDCAEEDCSEE